MHETRIKICGITSPDDARACADLGVDYLGIIFANGERRVTKAAALAIREAVPAAMLVGVFADAPIAHVADIAATCRLNMIQLHGRETPEYCDELSSRVSLPIIKALQPGEEFDVAKLVQYRRTSYFLFDLGKNSSGLGDDVLERLWSQAAVMRDKGFRIFLAGSLTVGNVRAAVQRVRPYAVDVARGVELSPGVKNPHTVAQFIREVTH